MRVVVLIIILLSLHPAVVTAQSGMMLKKDLQKEWTPPKGQRWIEGVLTGIDKRYMTINRKKYRYSSSVIVKYGNSVRKEGVSFFRAIESAVVRARMERGVVTEVVVVGVSYRE